MKRIRKLLGMVCVCAMMLSMTAFAVNHDFEFEFKNLHNQQTGSYGKSDNDQKWYISLDTVNSRTGRANNMSSTNIFGCKMHRNYNDTVDTYHTFSNYVSAYPIGYSSTVYKNDVMHMVAKKDSNSTSSAYLNISGRFAP